MYYSPQDISYIERYSENSVSKHINVLIDKIRKNADYAELFNYGLQYVPKIWNEKSRSENLDLLNDYKPEIVEYFNVLSEIPSIPQKLKDLATDLAIYSNGESVQTDKYYQNLIPSQEIKKALDETEPERDIEVN